jgi:hypothetical protein
LNPNTLLYQFDRPAEGWLPRGGGSRIREAEAWNYRKGFKQTRRCARRFAGKSRVVAGAENPRANGFMKDGRESWET